ncbi:hypothetical protein PO878_18550 [Iamia majanohamensis]|uniref:Uncharacterized protein n=1 Tax=Iamia majanohamensis TaxID=467976 RepID=A0AAF0BRD9_9ACTN|nr:hypothetical protein [Iamia majanohamensis]WCO66501.1 hypothetical protein PO878_18550 [Iamia majanohamensis]
MRAIPRALTATALGVALVLGGGPGGAQEAEGPVVPRAEAEATALRVSLFGNELVVSSAASSADAVPSATADGTGAFLGTQGFGQTSAQAGPTTPTAGGDEPVCSPLSLPADVPLPVDAVTACSTARADAGADAATGTASGLAADISVLSTADSPVPVEEVTDTVVTPLLALLGGQAPLPEQLTGLTALLQQALEGDVTVLALEAGATTSTSTAATGSSSATSAAEGLVVTVLDRSVLGPVLTITVGRSEATATYEDGTLAADHVTAPVSFQLGADVAAVLGAPTTPIPVPEGQTVDLPLPAPLTSRITVAGGQDEVGETTARSTSSNIRLDLGTGLPGGGVVVAVADAAAAVEGPPAVVEETPPAAPPAAEPPPAPAPTPERNALPRTGGDGGWVPVTALLLLGAGVVVVGLRRTRRADA